VEKLYANQKLMAKASINKVKPKITVDKNMRDYKNEPAFVKAAERAREFLKKHGLPKAFKKKAK
jgi:hypothetical protein